MFNQLNIIVLRDYKKITNFFSVCNFFKFVIFEKPENHILAKNVKNL